MSDLVHNHNFRPQEGKTASNLTPLYWFFGAGFAVIAIWMIGLRFAKPLFAGFQRPEPPPQMIVTEMRIPTADSGLEGLAAVMVRPPDAGPHPLALITHGIPRDASERPDMTPLSLIPQAREFARRGWTAVIVMRPGFGNSGGASVEEASVCGRDTDFLRPTVAAAAELRQAVAYLVTRPEVDPSRMIGIGVSAGGLAMVGLADDPPPGMLATISFAGGRGSDAPDHVCNPDAEVSTFGYLGKHAKIPMLWVYASNDHFFGPQLAQSFYSAYVQNGGNASFVAEPPFGDDGHMLFSRVQGIAEWTPAVDAFLRNQNLVLRDEPWPLALANVDPPSSLRGRALAEFQIYLAGAPHKSFAASADGHFAYIFGRPTAQDAKQQAVQNCMKYSANQPCIPLMVDDERIQN